MVAKVERKFANYYIDKYTRYMYMRIMGKIAMKSSIYGSEQNVD